MNYFNYFTEIEETFVRRRGRNLFLSPLDWALMESWKERKIPLRIILRGINNVFDTVEKNPNRMRSIKSLAYCKDEVESLFEDWRRSQVGKSIEESDVYGDDAEADKCSFTASSIESHLEKVIIELRNAAAKSSGEIRQTIESVLSDIETSKHSIGKDSEHLERKLDDLEKRIDSTLSAHCDPLKLAEFKNQIENELSKHRSSMKEDIYQSTFDLMLLKRLRDRAEIPRLSLFYL